jgi:hypothetical protein
MCPALCSASATPEAVTAVASMQTWACLLPIALSQARTSVVYHAMLYNTRRAG